MRLRSALIAVILAWVTACDSADIPDHDIWIRVTTVKEIEVGRRFPLTVELVYDKGLIPEDFRDDVLAPLSVRHIETLIEAPGSRVRETRRYHAVVATLDDVFVPGPTFSAQPRGGGEVVTAVAEPIEIRVLRNLDPEAPGEVELPGGLLSGGFPWAIAIGLVAALGVLAVGVRRRRRVESDTPTPEAPAEAQPGPADIALARLGRLREGDVEGPEEIGEFYRELSGIVREYLSERFGVRTRERTTEEILAGHPAPAPHDDDLGKVLGEADMVKFANALPAPDAREACLTAAERFVKGTGASAADRRPEGTGASAADRRPEGTGASAADRRPEGTGT